MNTFEVEKKYKSKLSGAIFTCIHVGKYYSWLHIKESKGPGILIDNADIGRIFEEYHEPKIIKKYAYACVSGICNVEETNKSRNVEFTFTDGELTNVEILK